MKIDTSVIKQGLESINSEFRSNKFSAKNSEPESSGESFSEILRGQLKEINETQKVADKAATDLATGKNTNIHETMLAATNAELSFNLMVQVRNKALEAYQEIMRMPV